MQNQNPQNKMANTQCMSYTLATHPYTEDMRKETEV